MRLADRLRTQAKRLKHEISALYYACRDPRLPWLPKVIAGIAIGYALSPIDLIPDFIPILGYVDDIIILPLLIALAIRLIPPEVMEQARVQAQEQPLTLPKNRLAAVLIVSVWVLLILLVCLYVYYR